MCEKRKATRFCPVMGEKICAVCCGTEREVTIDCPSDCSYLLAAHRYEDEHQHSLPAGTPLLDEKIPQDIVYTHQQLMAALGFSIAKFCAVQPAAVDGDVLAAIQALAQTYKTLSSGIIYEKPPDAPLPRELYAALIALISEVQKQQAERSGAPALKDMDLFYLWVFLYRMGLLRTNGRPRSRRFIAFLRSQFPQSPELKREESRIIVP
jgi:hypothetical protein